MFLSYSREVGESNSPEDAQEVPAHGPRVPSQDPPRANTDPRIHRPHWVPMLWSPDTDEHKAVPVDLERWGVH